MACELCGVTFRAMYYTERYEAWARAADSKGFGACQAVNTLKASCPNGLVTPFCAKCTSRDFALLDQQAAGVDIYHSESFDAN